MKKLCLGLFSLTSLVLLSACSDAGDEIDTTTTKDVTWSDVSAIVVTSCGAAGSSCHNTTTAQGNLDFTTITEDEFLATASLARIQDEENPMPPTAGSTNNPTSVTLASDDRNLLVKFLSQ